MNTIQPNAPIEILPVDNGFIVKRLDKLSDRAWTTECLVFQSMSELACFLGQHFTYRQNNLIEDSCYVTLNLK